jgi:small subunit ribosomal protein S2
MADTKRLPDAVVVIDMKKEALAVREARRLGIPVVGLVDTNCDPDDADFVIPGNDDAIRSTGLIIRVLADAVALGQAKNVKVSDFEAPAEGEEAAADGETPAAETPAAETPAPEMPAAETPAAEAAPAAEEHPAQEPEPAAVAAAGDDQTSSEDKTSE